MHAYRDKHSDEELLAFYDAERAKGAALVKRCGAVPVPPCAQAHLSSLVSSPLVLLRSAKARPRKKRGVGDGASAACPLTRRRLPSQVRRGQAVT